MEPRIARLGFLLVLAGLGWASAFGEAWELSLDDWRLSLGPNGEIRSLLDGKTTLMGPGLPGPGIRVAVPEGGDFAAAWSPGYPGWRACETPVSAERTSSGAVYEYAPAGCPLRVRCEVALERAGDAVAIRRSVTLTPAEPLTAPVVLSVALPLSAAGDSTAFVPRQDGIGEEVALHGEASWTWPLDGAGRPIERPAQHLAIPLVSVKSPEVAYAVAHVADPFFTSSFSLRTGRGGPSGTVDCVFLGDKVPLKGPVTRTFWSVVYSGGWDRATAAWYATALADVPEGPDWLHEIAWQHYDYLSYGGRGWFEDIDAVEKLVAPKDRGKVMFTLHGWYDVLGRYTFDAKTGRLDDTWTAFPNAAAVREKGFNVSESFAMTKAELHRRIRYAKDRGFRVCLYFADGLTACEGAGVFAEDKLLHWGGWQGPDTQGRSYAQNPAHPEVYRWYVEYLKALLAEYGSEIDALVWDETFMIRVGMTAPEQAPEPAYLCEALMRLTRELTRTTTDYRKDLAFLASDCIGGTTDETTRWTDVPPYAAMTHGCYQDSHSRPSVWPYGLFPNLRNTLWSCNWSAVTNFGWTRFGVEHYDTPVATSNGWLDSKGVARLSEAERAAVVELFDRRKGRRQELRWLEGPAPAYE